MPKITITQAFNYSSGGVVKTYKQGEQDVPQAVADHAQRKGFAAKSGPAAKAKDKAVEAIPAQPAAAK